MSVSITGLVAFTISKLPWNPANLLLFGQTDIGIKPKQRHYQNTIRTL